MNLHGLREAIIARVQADTGSGGLWAAAKLINSISYTFEARGSTTGIRAAQPFVVFDFPSVQPRDGYAYNLHELFVRFHTFYPFLRNKDAAITAAATIQNRIYGDALVQANRTPSYGFDRHLLVLTTTGDAAAPWAGGVCLWQGTAEAHENDCLHFIDTYQMRLSRTRTLGYTS